MQFEGWKDVRWPIMNKRKHSYAPTLRVCLKDTINQNSFRDKNLTFHKNIRS